MVKRYQSGVIGVTPKGEHDMSAYHEAMEKLEFNRAIDEVWLMVRSLNQYIENVKPWEIAKKVGTDTDAEGHLTSVLAYAVGAILQIGDLLVPFLPGTADAIHKTFETGVIVESEGVLFPRIYIHTPNPNAPKA
jgi:methionyl-tRNA synthetase